MQAAGKRGGKQVNERLGLGLVKNMTYEVDGIDYITDELGRGSKTAGDLDNMVRVRLGNQQIRAVDVKDGVRGIDRSDQGGHIIGARFFGAGEQLNYYSQSAKLNQGAWRTMENIWAKAMATEVNELGNITKAGQDVKVEIRAIFAGQSARPIGFDVDWWIDGKKFNQPFENPM